MQVEGQELLAKGSLSPHNYAQIVHAYTRIQKTKQTLLANRGSVELLVGDVFLHA